MSIRTVTSRTFPLSLSVSDMGIFDFIEMRQHLRAVQEYLLYMEVPERRINEWDFVSRMIDEHLSKISKLLEIYEK